ncbi:hypothetical protein D9M68_476180 [compost metagenome]
MVCPVTVKQSPCSQPFFNKYFITAGTPPILCRSSIMYRPLGFMSAKTGIRLLIVWKSSCVKGTSTLFAMAMRCNTAFVEPPKTMMVTIAFSKALRVMISLGLMSFSNKILMALPAAKHSACFSSLKAGLEEEKGKLIPSASIAAAMVLAV